MLIKMLNLISLTRPATLMVATLFDFIRHVHPLLKVASKKEKKTSKMNMSCALAV